MAQSFLKAEWKPVERLTLFADLQGRWARFRYEGEDMQVLRDTFQVETADWFFFNPKGGLRWHQTEKLSFYGSVGMTQREPARLDFLGGADRALQDLDPKRVASETVVDAEPGVNYRSRRFQLQANLFWMEFWDEIVATGELNAFGLAIRRNVPRSFRRGLELQYTWQPLDQLHLTGNASYTWARIQEVQQAFDVYDEDGAFVETVVRTQEDVQPLLTPPFIAHQQAEWQPLGWLAIGLQGRFVSQQHLDNTGNDALSTDAFAVGDAWLRLQLDRLIPGLKDGKHGRYMLQARVNNFTNTTYEPSGYSYPFLTESGGQRMEAGTPYFYPAPPSNFMLSFRAEF